MSGVPYVFANASTSIPLSQLDANFNTVATLGNASIGLGNTTTSVGNLTLANVTIVGGSVNATVTSNLFTLGNTTIVGNATTTSVGNLTLANPLIQNAASGSYSNVTITTIQEPTNVTSTAANATLNLDFLNSAILYCTSNAAGNFTVNIRGNSTTTFANAIPNNTSVSMTLLATQGNTAYYNSLVQIDGNTVTPYWQGGTAPTKGNSNGIDGYTYVVIKSTGTNYTVLATQTQF